MSINIRVTHTVDRLDRDMRSMPSDAARGMTSLVASNAKQGNRRAKAFAVLSARRHGKHYPDAFSAESRGLFAWEYGPDASKPQGNMSFEFGSVNQPPHLDLAQSADIVAPLMAQDVRKMLDRLFWP